MHIAIDARIVNSSTGRYIERLLTYLESLDSPHEFSILVQKKDRDYWKPTKSNFRVVVADYHQYTFAEQLGFYFFLRKLNADLIHFCMPQQPLLYHGRAVTTVHDLNLIRITENEGMSWPVLKTKQAIFSFLLRTVAKRSARVIVPTNYTRDDLLSFQRLPEEKIVVTYESADLVSETEVPIEQFIDKNFLLVVGRAETYKNQRGAIEAHQLLLIAHPDVHLVIVGKRDQTSHDLEEWTLREGYRNITFFGFATDEQLAWLYNHCRVYVFPSFMEGFGLPGLEAMKHGAPVASSNATCLPEVYADAAIYFDPEDHHDMAQKIDTILSSEPQRNALIEKGRKRAASFSWQRMAQETHDIYNSVLTD
ncbi:glycosyltransferase family 4 protein [Candidatus Saccharibacteria bacterium]|nr:glycosyltransferase family 4 protein [Candidatus Saccharibacteria bacterium]